MGKEVVGKGLIFEGKCLKKKSWMVRGQGFLAVFVVGLITANGFFGMTIVKAGFGDVLKSFTSPGSCPEDLAWDGTYLWNCDFATAKIYKLTTSGTVVSSFNSPGPNPEGLGWDGTYLWNSDPVSNKIYKLTTSGTVVSSFNYPYPNPTGYLDGITCVGTSYLYVADTLQTKIIKLTTSGTVVSSFNSPGSASVDVAWDGTYLWVDDMNNDKIYKLTTSGTIMKSFNTPGGVPSGLGWDGTNLWHADSSTDKIYQIDITEDTTPPTPNPSTWATVPYATGPYSISMTATTASDPSTPVYYSFVETTGHSGGANSGWQTSPTYTNINLICNTLYTYKVQTKDNVGNTGSFSTSLSATTNACLTIPTVQTLPATYITANSADFNGKVTNFGGVENWKCNGIFEYRKVGDTTWIQPVNNIYISSDGSILYFIFNLADNTNYEYRAGARNSAGTGWGNAVTFTTLKGDLSINKVKMVQTILTSDTLVKNKNTIAAIYIDSTFKNDNKIQIKITYNFGAIYTETGTGGTGVVVAGVGDNNVQSKETIIYVPGGEPQKGTWLLWTKTGSDSGVSVSIDSSSSVSESDENNNKWTDSVTVVDTNSLSIGSYRILPPKTGAYDTPTADNVKSQMDKGGYFIRSTYPISESGFTNTNEGDITGNEVSAVVTDYGGVDKDLAQLDTKATALKLDRALGITTSGYFTYHGLTTTISKCTGVSWSSKGYKSGIVDYEYWTVAAHELGHTYGLCTGGNEDYTVNPPVGSRADGYWCSGRKEIQNGISFMGGVNSQNSYTDAGSIHTGRDVWVADSHYNTLLSKFKKSINVLPTTGSILFIHGFIDQNDNVEFLPMYCFENQSAETPEPGNYNIQLLDKNGALLTNASFDPCFYLSVDPIGTIETDAGYFCFSLPYNDQIDKIVIKDKGNTISEKTEGNNSHTPSMNLLSPNGGENLVIGKSYTITWQANDSDNDKILTSVLYSADNGGKWSFLTFETTASQFIWDTSNLKPGYNYKIKLLATDGFHTVTDISDETFVVSIKQDNNPPSVKIITPSKGIYKNGNWIMLFPIRLVIGQINVTANASDYETGIIKVEFYLDDVYKTTVTNEPFILMWNESSFGKHVLKVIAYDWVGHQASSEIKVWKFF